MKKIWFQNKPITLPINSMQTFLCNVPSSGKVNEIKRKLNIISVNIVSSSMKWKDKNMQDMTTPSNNPNTV
jgi:hypothetical protein